MPSSVPCRRVCFGPFEADLRSGELRRDGVKVRLQEQPFHVLAVLLERPGDVVTREELHSRLWPADTFVDFDHGLNTAIKKLRQALDDSPDTPRFVETLARRGYRLIAPVAVEPAAEALSGDSTGDPPAGAGPTAADRSTHGPGRIPRSSSRAGTRGGQCLERHGSDRWATGTV
jgi:cholera toxin transcriptional activator